MDVAWSVPVFRHLTLLLGVSKGWGSAQSEAGVTYGPWDERISQKPLELPGNAGKGKV